MKATGAKAATLTMLFGGATNNEGLGLFTLSFDWQYITSAVTSLPLKLQLHTAIGLGICYIVMLGIWYGNVWQAKSQPFMSSSLRTADGGKYPTAKVFVGGVLSTTALAEYGLPKLSSTFAYSLLMANAAVSIHAAQTLYFLHRSAALTRW